MATILLNVKVNENDIKQAEQQISKIINGTNGNGRGNGVQSATTNVNNLQKSVANLLNTLKGSKDKYAPELFTDLETRIKKVLVDVKDLNKQIGDTKPTKEQINELKKLKKEYEKLGAEYATVRVESQKLTKENKLAIPNVDNLRKKYANLLTTIQNQEKYYKKGTFSKLTEDIKEQLTALKGLKPTASNYAEELNKIDAKLNELSADFAETRQSAKNFHGSLGEIVKGFIKFQAAAMIVMKPLQLIRTAWQDTNETLVDTENRVIELRRVAGKIANSDELYSLAQKYGQTFENVSEITLNFARNGMEWAEALQATEAALLAINVAELDATQASEGMIAVMNQFKIEASELEEVVDKLNVTADNAAVTTERLLTALQRTGSSAVNANLTLEETVGIITALSEATGRSGQNLGTAVNSLIQFSTKAEALETFEKLGGGVATAVENYRMGAGTVLDIWRELSDVVKTSGNKSEGILGGLFGDDDWRSLNEELQTELGTNFATVTEIYDTASTFRKNYFIALLQNLDQVQETLDNMNAAQGYSQKENKQYLDTYTAKVNRLQAKWREVANDKQGLLGIKKTLVDIAYWVLEIYDVAGGLRTLLITVGTVMGVAFGAKIVSGVKALVTAIKGLNIALTKTQLLTGVIGAGLVVLSAVAGGYKRDKENQAAEKKEANEKAKSSWSEIAENATQINRLTEEYERLGRIENKTAEEEKKYVNLQKELAEALGYRAVALEKLDVGTEEYTNKLNELLGVERKYAAQKSQASANVYKDEYLAAQENLFDETPKMSLEETLGGVTKENKTSQLVDNVQSYIDNLYLGGKANTKEYTNAVNALEKYKEAAEKYISEQATATALKASIDGSVTNDAEFAELVKRILSDTQAGENYKSLVEGIVSDITGYTTTQSGGGSDSGKPSNEQVISVLEAIKENTEKTREIEDKMLALEEAKNQRTVRVFNAETGQWERVANQKDIDKAERDLHDHALDTVLGALKDGTLPDDFEIPDWLAALQAPTSDQQNKNFMTSLGILAGVYDKTPSSGGATTTNTNTTTNNDNRSISFSGDTIFKKVADFLNLPELFDAMGLFNFD